MCEGHPVTITSADAAVVAKIWAGPGVWSGLPKGTPFSGLADTTPDGTAGIPFPISDNWIKDFLLGYHSEFAFATAFKREYGSPPGKYRRTFLISVPAVQ
jgi:hypothetical protein